jgi:large subunit ribosomal protein L4
MTTAEATTEPAVGAKVTIERRNPAGELVDLVDLEPAIFGIRPNVALMHQVVTAQLAARRSGTQSTKTRSEVAGGGAKPYRQKGTGRARQGTLRAPQFAGGGVALGPKPRSYAQRTPRKMVRLALHSALSDRAAEGRVCLVDRWAFEVPKTKDAIAALAALGLSGRVLVVLGSDDTVAERSFANLQHVHLVEGAQLSAYEVLANDWVLFTTETIPGGVSVSAESSSTVPSAASAPADETAAGADTSAAQPSASVEAALEAEAHDNAVIASSEVEASVEGVDEDGTPGETAIESADKDADVNATAASAADETASPSSDAEAHADDRAADGEGEQ